MLWQFISVSIKHANISGEVREFLFGEIKADESDIVERTMVLLEEQGIILEYSLITVLKPYNNSVHLNFTYTDSVGIPLINKYFYIDKEVDETIKKR